MNEIFYICLKLKWERSFLSCYGLEESGGRSMLVSAACEANKLVSTKLFPGCPETDGDK